MKLHVINGLKAIERADVPGRLKKLQDSETMKGKVQELQNKLQTIRASLLSIREQVKNRKNPPTP